MKRTVVRRRGELVLALIAAAAGIMAFIWVSILAVGEPPPREAQHAPARMLKPEVYDRVRAALEERRRGLEKVFKREYPDPFAR